MELLEVCLKTTYCQVDDKFFQQKESTTMGSSLSPMESNIFFWGILKTSAGYRGIETISVAPTRGKYTCDLASRIRQFAGVL